MIPAITHPLGRYWDQPERESILVDDTHALMTKRTFDQLCEYSTSIPSGVYQGKMWRRHDGAHFTGTGCTAPKWLLCWYANVDETLCKIEMREVIVV